MNKARVPAGKLLDIIQEWVEESELFPHSENGFIELVEKDLKSDSIFSEDDDRYFYNVVLIIRDHLLDYLEGKILRDAGFENSPLFPTVGQLRKLYNSSLEKLLLIPGTQNPRFIVSGEKPADSGTEKTDYMEVTIPGVLHWLFPCFTGDQIPRFWVDKDNTLLGMHFLRTISSACSGIEHLMDLESIAENPAFQVPEIMIEDQRQVESITSRRRRKALCKLASIFTNSRFDYNLQEIAEHYHAFLELLTIPPVNRIHVNGLSSGDYTAAALSSALISERLSTLYRTSSGLIIVFAELPPDNPLNEKIYFHLARTASAEKDYYLAEKAITRSIHLNPSEDYYKSCSASVIERTSFPDPLSGITCPDVKRLSALITGNIPEGEDELFLRHVDFCRHCKNFHSMLERTRLAVKI
jgi:hypothetical protein